MIVSLLSGSFLFGVGLLEMVLCEVCQFCVKTET